MRDLAHQAGVDAPVTILDSLVPIGIKAEALRLNVDLIITGRGRAKTGLRMWSNLHEIVREAPCPVLSL
jgi:nucleotide-binding universal stress UspA family protein